MKWIEKLFGKRESSSPEIGFDALPAWLDARYRNISDEIGRYASDLYPEINDALSEIKESTVLLEEAEPEGRYHLKMVKICVSNRDNMVKQVRMLLENITIPQSEDIESIVVFHENAIQTLTVCLENMMKSYQYTKLMFLDESKQVIADVNALGRLLNQLIEPVNSRKNILDAFKKSQNILQDLKNTTLDIETREKTIKVKEENIVLLRKELEEKQKALTLLRESEQWKQFMNYGDELEILVDDACKKESEINSIISPLNKALGRLKQLSESGRYTLKPESRESLNLCFSDPVKVSPEFFIEFQTIVESGVLNLTPEKTNKILEQTRLAASSLGSLRSEYQALALDIERKKDELSGMEIAVEEKQLTDQSGALREKLAESEKELEQLKEHLPALKQNIESKKQELQQMVAVIDSKIWISY